jgi:hypothetical protein
MSFALGGSIGYWQGNVNLTLQLAAVAAAAAARLECTNASRLDVSPM